MMLNRNNIYITQIAISLTCSNLSLADTKKNEFFVLNYAFNIANFKPIIIKNCVKVGTVAEGITMISNIIKDLELFSQCTKHPDAVNYTCMNEKEKIITKVILMKNKSECLSTPITEIKKMKTLLNK